MSAHLSLNNTGKGTLTFGGQSYACKGKVGFHYTKDITLRPNNAYETKWSSQYKTRMNYAVGPIQWQRDAYIHSGNSNSNSHGCVQLNYYDAQAFYNYVKSNHTTKLITSYKW